MHKSAPTTLDLDGAIQFVKPAPGNLEQSQTSIIVQFNFGWTGELVLNGSPIPDDQLSVRATTGAELTFLPGPEKIVSRLTGEQVVTARYWRLGETRDQARSFTWRFQTL